MTYVITQSCCIDASCIAVCPVACIHPTPGERPFATSEMLYIDPETCIDCGACVDECPVDAVVADIDMTAGQEPYLEMATAYYERNPIEGGWTPPSRGEVKVPAGLGTLRVAIVGTGPSACYAALELLAHRNVEVDMFDRLPTPFGLVRAGVAPDHQATKGVTDRFRAAIGHRRTRCYFGVEVGKDISHVELLEHAHAVLFATGASSDRRMYVPGEDLPGSLAATDFVAWYNGNPDHADLDVDFSGERAVIIGNGNVALDVARVIVTDPDALAKTDMADHAIAALRGSQIREVVVIGRRGPAQAAYSNPELLALGQLDGVDIVIETSGLELDDVSRSILADPDTEPRIVQKVKRICDFARRAPVEGGKRIVLKYLASPVEVSGGSRVESITLGRNSLVEIDGRIEARPTGETATLTASLIVRSIGYHGRPLLGVPFDARRGIIPNRGGRVFDPETDEIVAGTYVVGWAKRGPAGVIGTNNQCSADTVEELLADFIEGRLGTPAFDRDTLAMLVGERVPQYVDYEGWQRIDEAERDAGRTASRIRTKFVSVADLLAASRIAE